MHLRLFLLLLLVPLTAWAKESPGVRLYERGEYQRAVRALTSEVKSKLRKPKDRALARVYLAASLHALGKTEEARQQLEVLAREYPAQRVDPALFPPELVELEQEVRAKTDPVQQAERERLAAEEARRQQEAAAAEEARRQQELAAAEEARRQQAEEEARRQQELAAQQVTTPVEAPSRWRLRPEATSFVDVRGRSWGPAAGLTFGYGAVEGTARAVLGDYPAFELEGGVVFGSGFFQPRLALRGSVIPQARILGAGAMVGARLNLSPRFVVLGDVGAVYFRQPSPPQGLPLFTQFGVLATVGLGFNLLPQ
jgi:predicted  nucleic acid-binding Zn-ribbon protein